LIVPGLGDSIVPRQIQRIILAILIVFAVSPLLGLQDSESPPTPATGTITGTVRDGEGQPKHFANVILLQTHLGAMADTVGRYQIANVPAGEYRARASFLGYEPAETTIVVKEGTETAVDFVLRCLVAPGPVMRDGVLGTIMGSVWEPLRRLSDGDPHPISETFAAQLHREFASEGGNVIHSPLCVAAACGLLLRGARGETAREIADMLHTEADATTLLATLDTLRAFLDSSIGAHGDEWSTANAAWFDNDVPLRPDFVDAIHSTPTDTVAAIDFAGAPDESRDAINRWARDGTRGRIPEILPPGSVDRTTVLVLANAVYLRARWLHPFAEHRTADELFWVKGTDSTRVPTMQSTEQLPYGETGDAQVVRLDYRGEDIGMVIVLPRTRDGFAELEQGLDAPTIEELRASLAPTRVELHLPRWRAASDWDIIPILQSLGISRAFRLGECQLFGAIADPGMARQVFVSGVFHAATVDVYEQGTEASAVTAIAAGRGLVRRLENAPPIPVHVDHPFLWWIQENTTGTILFMGRVVDPRAAGTTSEGLR
jgi:serpin B